MPTRRLSLLALVLLMLTAATARAQSELLADGGIDARHLRHALQSSLRLAMMQHALRVGFEEKTRAELGGPFFREYGQSLRWPRQWGDGDSWQTNYIGHPIQGAASAFIWIDSQPRAPRVFAAEPDYWRSRLQAVAWATAYSVQFELGPFSEASIGNVGLRPATVGWVDHVITPAGGWVFAVGEDVLDRFVIARLEQKIGSPVLRVALRMFLNPSRATANVSALRSPWFRADRPFQRQP